MQLCPSDTMVLPEEALLASADPVTTVGEVLFSKPEERPVTPYLLESLSVIRENCRAIEKVAAEKREPDSYLPLMDQLFRPLLLDGITMLELAGENTLANEFSILQQQFMTFMRGPRTEALAQTLSLEKLHDLTEQYADLIRNQM